MPFTFSLFFLSQPPTQPPLVLLQICLTGIELLKSRTGTIPIRARNGFLSPLMELNSLPLHETHILLPTTTASKNKTLFKNGLPWPLSPPTTTTTSYGKITHQTYKKKQPPTKAKTTTSLPFLATPWSLSSWSTPSDPSYIRTLASQLPSTSRRKWTTTNTIAATKHGIALLTAMANREIAADADHALQDREKPSLSLSLSFLFLSLSLSIHTYI